MDLYSNTNPEGILASWTPGSIVVLRALMLGDLLCAVPALRALRRHLPETRITLIGLPWARDFSLRFGSYIDDFIEFPGWPGLPERTPEVQVIPWWLREMQERKFDLAIQLHGSGSYVNTATALLGAERSAGYFLPGDWCPDPASYLPWPEGDHEIQMHLRLMQFLGVPTESDDLEFPIGSRDVQDFNALLRSIPVSSPYVCIHPGARLASRRWDPARFAAVADALHADGYAVVLTGTAAERPIADRVLRAARSRIIDMCGKTTLGSAALLVTRASLLISNDTGMSHVAAALRTPSIILTMGSDPERWAPLDDERHRLVVKPIPCRPCTYDQCPIGHPCAAAIGTVDVIGLARTMLGQYGSSHRIERYPQPVNP